MSERYDFIIAGGGLAGLSLAYHLMQSNLRQGSMLIIDQERKDHNDRTWCFWTNQSNPFDEIVYRSWSQLHFKSRNWQQLIGLQDYRYKMIRGIDFYRFTQGELANRTNVEFAQGQVDCIEDDAEGANVCVGGRTFRGQWAFDSRFQLSRFKPDTSKYHYLQQHFKGWMIETRHAAFDPQAATLFDFRTEQENDFRFFYVLPVSEHQALIEYVHLGLEDNDQAIRTYLDNVLGIQDYRILGQEGGVNPLTDYAFARRVGKHTLAIGTLGGRVKATSGYAFVRIQQDSAAIIRSLADAGHPFQLPSDSRYYRLCDSLMLQLMCRHGAQVTSLFVDLFKKNPIERVFRFLDERASAPENLALMASLPPGPFLQAFFRTRVRHRL